MNIARSMILERENANTTFLWYLQSAFLGFGFKFQVRTFKDVLRAPPTPKG